METDLTGCCFASPWADYLSKVAEVTRLPVNYIWHKLAYAQGLQYLMVWYYRNDFVCKPLSAKLSEVSALETPL